MILDDLQISELGDLQHRHLGSRSQLEGAADLEAILQGLEKL